MKKRLSLLMATLMIITLLPISAFAAVHSTDYQTLNYTTAHNNADIQFAFKIKKESTVTTVANQQVQLTLSNVKIKEGTTPTVTLTGATTNAAIAPVVAGSTIVFAVPKDAIGAGNEAKIAVEFKGDFSDSSEGDVKINVDATDLTEPPVATDAAIPDQDIKIGVVKEADTSDLAIAVKDSEKTVSFDGGELSQFTVSNFGKIDGANDTVVISIDDDHVDLTKDTKIILDGKAITHNGTPLTEKFTVKDGKIYLFKGDVTNTSKSLVVIPVVDRMGKKVSEGNIAVVVEAFSKIGTNDEKLVTSSKAVIGKVVDYNVTMTITEKGKKEIPSVWGGEEATVRVTLKGPKGSLLNREIEFVADGSNIVYGDGNTTPSEFRKVKAPGALSISGDPAAKKENTVFKDREFSIKGEDFDKAEEISFEIKIRTAGSKDGMATLTASQRGWEVKADLAKITPKFKATAEVNPIKKGEARNTSNVVITEAKAGLLDKGENLVLTFDTRRDYTQITSKSVKVEATNGMKLDTTPSAIKMIKGNDGKDVGIAIPITRTSTGEPAVITISGLNVAVDGSATDDIVKLDSGLIARGKKVESDNAMNVSSVDYIKVVKEYALESILTVFTIGQTQYTVNGEAKTAASAPYIKNGKTMLPIRALAESLGLKVQWNGATKTATFTDDSKVAAVTIGAEKLYVNGTPVPLAAKAELVNGTTFVELRSLATAFGVQIDWDAAAKTATVSK